jgi:hypothetical protein
MTSAIYVGKDREMLARKRQDQELHLRTQPGQRKIDLRLPKLRLPTIHGLQHMLDSIPQRVNLMPFEIPAKDFV